MNPQRDILSDALREMASASPEGSPELRARLDAAFAHHHAWRRRKRAAVVVILAGCVAISAYWLKSRAEIAKVKVAAPASQTAQAASPAPLVLAPEKPTPAQRPSVATAAVKARVQPKQVKKVRNHVAETPAVTAESTDFVALPTFDPDIPVGDSRMVRMDLPGSALQLIGYPVDGRLLDRRILTDVLVGQDGMPYAVRLVQTRNVR